MAAQRSDRESLKRYTERAIETTQVAELISPVVYLPRRLRGQKARMTVDNLRVTLDPETVAENHIRIADADPIGFLIACMQGQPIPELMVKPDGSVTVRYAITPLEERISLARWLGAKVTFKHSAESRENFTKKHDERAEYNAMINGKLNGVQETTEKD